MSSQLRQWFDSIDKNRSGEVECHELQAALVQGNLHFSLSTVAQMIRLHNNNRAPRLTYPEFQNLHRFLGETQRAFTDAQPNAEGNLTYNQLATVLKGAGYNLEQQVFSRIVETFDPEMKQAIDLTAFIRLTMFLRSTGAAFAAFDPYQRGRVTLDFSQFLYAASNII